jgi:copper chaperone CopZ
MSLSAVSCDLCGLSLKHGTMKWASGDRDFFFCCMGCRQVFIMLMAAADSPDPEAFKETELFRKCREMGIIPESEADLKRRLSKNTATPYFSTFQRDEDAENDPETIDKPDSLSIHLKVGGMWCPACAWVIETALKNQNGVIRSSCNFSTDWIRCEYNPVQTSPDEIIRTIDRLGYRAALPEEDAEAAETKKDFIRFVVSAFLTVNVMMLSFALYSGFFTRLTEDSIYKISIPIFVSAGVVLF